MRGGIQGVFLLLLSLSLYQSPADAHEENQPEPDLQGRIVGPVRVQSGTISFRVEITNSGTARVQGSLSIKPFLLPLGLTGQGLVPAKDGVVLKVKSYGIDLRPGNQVSKSYTEDLARNIPRNDYLLAVVLDSKDQFHELNEKNNVTDFVSAGNIRRSLSPQSGRFDFYSEIDGAAVAMDNGVAHTLRTILQRSGVPEGTDPFPQPSGDLWARFMLADPRPGGHVYTLNYDDEKEEKQFYSLSWAEEEDSRGRPIYVDVYYQTPYFHGVPIGDYQFLTLMDSHDRVNERDESNNLDSHPFGVPALELTDFPRTWFAVSARQPHAGVRTVSFRNLHSGPVNWKAEIPTAAKRWLTVQEPSSGVLQAGETAQVNLSLASGSIPAGRYDTTLALSVQEFRNGVQQVPVKLFVHGDAVPVARVAPQELSFRLREHVHPPVQTFRISNTGTKLLYFQLQSCEEWISVSPLVSPLSGSILPGAFRDVRVIIHPEELHPGMHDGDIMLQTSDPSGPSEIMIRAEVLGS